MAVQASQLHDAARRALNEACKTPESWMTLLESVAPFYKYDFENALLISSQRPDATACATMRIWNKLNLWIRKGSKAIYSLDPNNPYAVQRVFDISDINARPDKLPLVRTLREGAREYAFAAMRERWNLDDMPGEYAMQLYTAITEAASEQIADYRN
ncbi:MAG: ArdC-like ssDNA-binding domain-containing protein, partial [Clostridia bacterium]|nr:ArdC-like ssDNA-binding domain-containing protein [Clostridia bacterium]